MRKCVADKSERRYIVCARFRHFISKMLVECGSMTRVVAGSQGSPISPILLLDGSPRSVVWLAQTSEFQSFKETRVTRGTF